MAPFLYARKAAMGLPSLNTFVAGQKVTATQLNNNTINAFNSSVLYKPMAKMIATATQSIGSSGTFSVITGLSVELDTDSMCDTVNSKIVFNTPGVYRLTGQASFAAGGTSASFRGVGLTINGTIPTIGQTYVAASATTVRVHCATIYRVTTGQAMQLIAGQASGGSISTDINYGACHMTAEWIGA